MQKALQTKPLVALSQSDINRFWSRVKKSANDGCWIFGSGNTYGTFCTEDGENFRAHRVSYFLETGKDPEGLLLRHTCDNPPCIRSSHLVPGTNADNTADLINRGPSSKKPKNARKAVMVFFEENALRLIKKFAKENDDKVASVIRRATLEYIREAMKK